MLCSSESFGGRQILKRLHMSSEIQSFLDQGQGCCSLKSHPTFRLQKGSASLESQWVTITIALPIPLGGTYHLHTASLTFTVPVSVEGFLGLVCAILTVCLGCWKCMGTVALQEQLLAND
jgi:hypothetical protein